MWINAVLATFHACSEHGGFCTKSLERIWQPAITTGETEVDPHDILEIHE